MIEVEIKGMKELLKKIEKVEGGKYLEPVLQVGGERVKTEVSPYPPTTIANDPSQLRWYERNYGPKWRTKSGAVHGNKTSEMLGKRWYVKPNKAEKSVTVGNPVSYAQYVHGDDSQAPFHGQRGWKKLAKTAKDNADEILKDMAAAFRQAWDKAK